MKIGKINTKKKVFIIAEIGNNHEGNFKLAKKMISAAAAAGVDAVKFQTFIPEQYVSSEDQSRINRLRTFQLNFNQLISTQIEDIRDSGFRRMSICIVIKLSDFYSEMCPDIFYFGKKYHDIFYSNDLYFKVSPMQPHRFSAH